ncbi:hypothetical protein BDN70DRAFT_896438 [Pholiota conissans]|uniref:Uncharacterized protein n=1 Tax=Pholiota conissans TaxID=109636 RepID=A0A9P6CYK0_9AGAR|nr:hypothetical protein BDN70DRAFT_896438 [Pholiota conissans]
MRLCEGYIRIGGGPEEPRWQMSIFAWSPPRCLRCVRRGAWCVARLSSIFKFFETDGSIEDQEKPWRNGVDSRWLDQLMRIGEGRTVMLTILQAFCALASYQERGLLEGAAKLASQDHVVVLVNGLRISKGSLHHGVGFKLVSWIAMYSASTTPAGRLLTTIDFKLKVQVRLVLGHHISPQDKLIDAFWQAAEALSAFESAIPLLILNFGSGRTAELGGGGKDAYVDALIDYEF